MSGFDERQKSEEAKFAYDEKIRFKAEARRNKLLANWVSELLGKSDQEAASYVAEVIAADFEEAGDEDVFRKLRADLDASKVDIDDETLRAKMTELMNKALEDVSADG